MTDTEEWLRRYRDGQQRFIDHLHTLEGLTVLGVEHFNDMPIRAAFNNPCISWIDDRKHSADEVKDWVVRTLKREHIQGEFYLGNGLRTYVRVQAASPWLWVRGLWGPYLGLTVVSLERDYELSLFWTEHCRRRDARGYWRDRLGYGAFRWIKPPANSPAFWG